MELVQELEPTPAELAEAARMEQEVAEAILREQELAATGPDWARDRARHTEAVPMDELDAGGQQEVAFVVNDLLPEGQLVLVVGEEGGGKTWLAHQIGHEASRGVRVMGAFDVPRPVFSVLIVDVEQTRQDVAIVNREMRERGVFTAESNVFYLDAYGRHFDDLTDLQWLGQQVVRLRPDILVIDTVTDAVSKPTVDESVNPLMTGLGWLLKNGYTRSVIGLAHPRKTGQGKDSKARDFDSLFGSHVWKSKASAVFWLTEGRLTVWKQRGQYLRSRWGRHHGDRYTWGAITRHPEGTPTTVSVPPDQAAMDLLLDQEVLKGIADNPDISASKLAADVLHKDKAKVLASVKRLLDSNTVATPKRGCLRVVQ